MFGKSLSNAGFGWGKKFGGGGGEDFHGNNWGGFHDKGKAFGEQDENKKYTPGQWDEEGGNENKEEKKPESDKEEGQENETIEQIVQIYDQLTPLIDKLRKS